MIWFGNLERLFIGRVPDGLPEAAEDRRMQLALERVAEVAPWLAGDPLVEAVAATGWVDRPTAERLMPAFRTFDPDRHFSDYVRRLSFRGRTVEDDFRIAVRAAFHEITGNATIDTLGPESCVRFTVGEREGVVLTYPEVGLTLSGRTREAVQASIEEMPDALVVVARTFDRNAADQLSGILYKTGVPGTLLTANILLGIRATSLRFGTSPDLVTDLMSSGRTVRSADVARLGDLSLPQRFHISGWKSNSTV